MNRYYQATVKDNDDPERRGRLRLEIPALLEDDDPEHPEWIAPRSPAAGGPSAIGLFWVPPAGSMVIVEVDHDVDRLRWLGTEIGARVSIPSDLREDYPRRAGWSSTDGSSVVYMDHDGYRLRAGASRSTLDVDDERARLRHHAGSQVELSAALAALTGTQVRLGDGGSRLILSDELLGDLRAYVDAVAAFMVTASTATTAPQIAAAAVTFLASTGGPVGTLSASIAASLIAGPPYLSTRSSTD